jgi:hypothetical protein
VNETRIENFNVRHPRDLPISPEPALETELREREFRNAKRPNPKPGQIFVYNA